MEIKARLIKPYNETDKLDFVVTYNHIGGYVIEETETELQALGYTEKEIEQQETERIGTLYLTGADVERGIYHAKGMDFDDIIQKVEELNSLGDETGIDVKALKIELKANHFYRGNPYVETVGHLLGFTPKQLDKFFEDGNYIHLIQENNEEVME